MMTFTGLEYLKIDIASNFGLDKEDWDARIAWTDDNDTAPGSLEARVSEAEEPALYHAAVQAYRKALRGEPTGYPISLDAAASGMQLLACLTGCEASAKLCGVVSTGHRADAYTTLYRVMCGLLGNQAKIERNDTKQAIMTSLYGSTVEPKKIFGEGEQLEAFYHVLETEAPGAWALNQVLQQLWQPYALSHDWVLPDNFHAHVKVEAAETGYVQFLDAPYAVTQTVNKGTKEGKSISPNIIHSIDAMVVREVHRRCDYNRDTILNIMGCLQRGAYGTQDHNPDDQMVIRLWQLYKHSGFLSARILDHLNDGNFGHVDPAVIRDLVVSLPESPFQVISNHDCFRVLPNHGNDLRAQYNQVLSAIADSDLLSFIASQVTGQYTPVTKAGNISAKILKADYALS